MTANLLKGNKIKLRAVEPADIDPLMQWENDDSIWEVSGTMAPFSRNMLERYIENAHLDIYQAGQLRLMILDVSDNSPLGTIDIFEFDPFNQRAGVGILIGDPQKRGNGYATEALALIKKYCFNHLGLNQLFCNILTDNKTSLKLFEKAGFEITGTKKKWIRTGSKYKDQYFLQLFTEG